MISSNDLPQARFMVRKIREGYDINEVDDYLDLLSETLKVHETGRSMLSGSAQLVTAEQVMNHRFTATKFRAGYDVVQVGAFLDKVFSALQTYEKNGSATEYGR